MCVVQSSAVQTQTTRVQLLESQAATGKVSVARLEQEQGVLSKMTVSCRRRSPYDCAQAHTISVCIMQYIMFKKLVTEAWADA